MDLAVCVSCRRHVHPSDSACPFCKTPRTPESIIAPPTPLLPVVSPAPKYGGPPRVLAIGGAGNKAKIVALLLCAIPPAFGLFGVHRFYTGHIGIGIAQLLTFGGCGIWQLLDLVAIFTGKYTDKDGRPLVSG